VYALTAIHLAKWLHLLSAFLSCGKKGVAEVARRDWCWSEKCMGGLEGRLFRGGKKGVAEVATASLANPVEAKAIHKFLTGGVKYRFQGSKVEVDVCQRGCWRRLFDRHVSLLTWSRTPHAAFVA